MSNKATMVVQEKYTVLITGPHLIKQASKLSEVSPFDLHEHLFSGLFFVDS